MVPHQLDGFNLRQADGVVLDDCTLRWAEKAAAPLGAAVRAEAVRGLTIARFHGDTAAHPILVP